MVPTGSMENTILIGDFMLVNKFIYGFKLPFSNKTLIDVKQPKRGDIVVFRYPMDPDSPEPAENYIRFFPRWLRMASSYSPHSLRFRAKTPCPSLRAAASPNPGIERD